LACGAEKEESAAAEDGRELDLPSDQEVAAALVALLWVRKGGVV
jgi:hypothetical protein